MVSSMVALKFDTPHGANQGLELALNLERQQVLPLIDAAVVAWPESSRRRNEGRACGLTWAAACDDGLCAAMRCLVENFAPHGIGPDFFGPIRDEVTLGSSVLFLLLGRVTADRLLAALRAAPKFAIIASSGELNKILEEAWRRN